MNLINKFHKIFLLILILNFTVNGNGLFNSTENNEYDYQLPDRGSTTSNNNNSNNNNNNGINNNSSIETKQEFKKIQQLVAKYFKIRQVECTSDTYYKSIDLNYCRHDSDRMLCYPSIPPNETFKTKCPFNEIIENNENVYVTRFCNENGTWNKADYTLCLQYMISQTYKTICRKVNKTVIVNGTLSYNMEKVECDEILKDNHDEAIRLIPILFLIGNTISIIPVSLAIIVFLSFRSLRCLRNMIHANMLLTFIIKSIIFIVFKFYLSYASLNQMSDSNSIQNQTKSYSVVCLIFQILWHYALLTSFFWMMVEGIYLISVVIAAYSSNKIKLWWYLVIGWAIPVIPLIPYTISTNLSSNTTCHWIKSDNQTYNGLFIDIPIYVVLAINFVLLVIILFVIIKKLRENNDAARARYNQYKKLIRATIVLFPLLGLTYGMFFWLPQNPKSLIAKIYCYVNIFLQTTQGIWVAVVYCFCNEEVKNAIKQKFRSWKATKNLELIHGFSQRKISRTSLATSFTALTRGRNNSCNNNNIKNNEQIMIPMLKRQNSRNQSKNKKVVIKINDEVQ